LPELSRERRLLVLGICCLSLFIVGLDSTIVNVALPSIGRELHSSVSGLQWTIDAYTLVLASLLMFSGSTADRIGRRKIFQVGLALFTLGSLLCSVAPGLGWLVAFRMLQAVGGSMLNPVAMSIITNTFTDPAERAKAIGVWGGVFGLSMALGPVAGGALVDSVGWRGIFWVNIPIGIAALVLTALFVPESRSDRYRRPDPLGQVLIIALLASLTYAIIEGPGSGWGSAKILIFFGVAVAALAVFLPYERRRRDPLIDPRFFRSAPFAGATAAAVSAFAALGGFLFLNTLYLQDVRGFSPLASGLYLLPMAVALAVCAPLSGRIVASRGARFPMAAAGIALIAGGVLLTWLTTGSSTGFLSSATSCSASSSAWSTLPSPTPRCPGCPGSRRASRPGWPRRAGRSAPRSA
jgi:EmrB/QacA subfamily drug resistance transporter